MSNIDFNQKCINKEHITKLFFFVFEFPNQF